MPSRGRSPLADAALRKEALDLLAAAWPGMSDAKRERVVQEILAIPAEATAPQQATEAQVFRDHRVFLHLAVIDRLGGPPLPDAGKAELGRIREAHPDWALDEGDRAHFGSWLSTGPVSWVDNPLPADFSLETKSAADVAELLASTDGQRGTLLRDWEQLWYKDFGRAFAVLEAAAVAGLNRADAWTAAIRAARVAPPAEARRLLPMLEHLSLSVLADPDMAAEGSGLLAVAARDLDGDIAPAFWVLWDRLLPVVAVAPVPADDDGWLAHARNSGGGNLAEALVQALSAARPRSRQGLGGKFRCRFDRLRGEGEGLRMARIVLAHQLAYLHAVDPDWVRTALLPLMDWATSPEAAALWDGYGWGLRIGAELWTDIRKAYIGTVEGGHLDELGRTRRNIVCVPVALAVHSPGAEADLDLFARLMGKLSADDLAEVASWIWRATLPGHRGPERGADNDGFMTFRVLPFLGRAWPRGSAGRSGRTAYPLAQAFLNTDKAFPDLVSGLSGLLGKVEHPDVLLIEMDRTRHADDHPTALLGLLEATVAPDGVVIGQPLKRLLDRMEAAHGRIASAPEFGRWRQIERTLNVLPG